MTISKPSEVKSETLLLHAQELAEHFPVFFEKKGPGTGDRATASYMRSLRGLALDIFGFDYSETPACGSAGFRFDYYFPDEAVVVEFAFGLHNPISEFERDVFKCLLALEDGRAVRKLWLVGKTGAIPRLGAPAPKAIVAFVKKRYDLSVEVMELRLPEEHIA